MMHFFKNFRFQQTNLMLTHKFLILFGLLSLSVFCILLAIVDHPYRLSHIFNSLQTPTDLLLDDIILKLRLTRALSAFVTGGLLALAGCLMQVLLKNPLADPYILGVSSGAAVCALLFVLLGFLDFVTIGGWIGSLISIALIFLLSKKNFHAERILLTGIALASGFSALISFILIQSNHYEFYYMMYWLLGDLNNTHMPLLEGSILLLGLLLSLFFSPHLNILVQGENVAHALGVNTNLLHYLLFSLSALCTASAIALAGCVGFIGLIVPHMLRLCGSHTHQWLLPNAVLLGGSLLTLADAITRNIFFPEILPVGIGMALIGIPIFLYLLFRNNCGFTTN